MLGSSLIAYLSYNPGVIILILSHDMDLDVIHENGCLYVSRSK